MCAYLSRAGLFSLIGKAVTVYVKPATSTLTSAPRPLSYELPKTINYYSAKLNNWNGHNILYPLSKVILIMKNNYL